MNRYKNIGILSNSQGRLYKKNVIFPKLEPTSSDIYVITTAGDRYDTLALDDYNDSTLWWIIASANNFNKDSLAVRPGEQLRIPMDIEAVLEEFDNLNSRR